MPFPAPAGTSAPVTPSTNVAAANRPSSLSDDDTAVQDRLVTRGFLAGAHARAGAEVMLTAVLAALTLGVSAGLGPYSLAWGVTAVGAFPLRLLLPRASALVAAVAAGLSSAVMPLVFIVTWLCFRGRTWLAAGAVALGASLAWQVHPVLSLLEPRMLSPLTFVAAGAATGLWAAHHHRLGARLRAAWQAVAERNALRAEMSRAAERASIARDMHDVLAHRLSLLALHASVLRLRPALGEELDSRLELLEATARQALEDLREVLCTLRPPELDVAMGREALVALADEARRAGQVVHVSIDLPDVLPRPVDQALQRIVREGLTNARKHAPTMPVTMRATASRDRVCVSLRNPLDGSGPRPGASPGLGLVGIEERATELSGRMTVSRGPCVFCLEVDLPLVGRRVPS